MAGTHPICLPIAPLRSHEPRPTCLPVAPLRSHETHPVRRKQEVRTARKVSCQRF